jgi:two-component system response regulator ChvI
MAAESATGARIAVVDDDPLFRESLGQNLQDAGYEVVDFDDGRALLDYFAGDGTAAAVLLDWRMPNMTGIEVLRHLREREFSVPVIFLTVLGDQVYEEAALHHGAVDFVEKSRSLSIVKKRLEIALATGKGIAGEGKAEERLRVGPLDLDLKTARAYWNGDQVPLTLTEFRIVERLAGRAGRDVRYRELYDQVHGTGFMAGAGEEGYRGNVRTLIKRIRQKFRALDDDFEAIENYPGFGYRWRDDGRPTS